MDKQTDEEYTPPRVVATELKEASEFKAPEKKETKKRETTISYSKPKKIVEKVKEHLGVTSNKDVGIKTFEYFVNGEDLNG